MKIAKVTIVFVLWFIIWVVYFGIQCIEEAIKQIFKWVKKPLAYLLDTLSPETIKNSKDKNLWQNLR